MPALSATIKFGGGYGEFILCGCPLLGALGEKMKKNFLLVFMLAFCNLLFGLSSDYFQKNKNIDILYVNSPEGLRVRDNASLNSKKIETLYDRMVVKVVSIGSEAVIDGIKSNWVQILLPVETINKGRNVYGWVFGGYLTDKLSAFSTEKWSDADLQRYLSRFPWVYGRDCREFSADGTYHYLFLEAAGSGKGSYSASMKNKSITVYVSYEAIDYVGPEQKETYKIIRINEDSMVLNIDGKEATLLPAFTNGCFSSYLYHDKIPEFARPSMNALRYSFVTSMINNLPGGNEKDIWPNLIKMGIRLDDPEYINEYNKTWNNQ